MYDLNGLPYLSAQTLPRFLPSQLLLDKGWKRHVTADPRDCEEVKLRGEMAQKGVQLDAERFSCSICLDLLKDPVMIACGHNYCMNCINKYWDDEEEEETHSCPQCQQTFRPRPVLGKNTMLAELVEELKKTGLLAAPGVHCYAGAEDVACDFCTGRKLKAIKSCLVCQVSYCETHLQPHYDVALLKTHKLVEPSKNLQENICSLHDEMMKILFHTDQQIICYLCSMDHLKGHDTVSAAAERTEGQREVEGSQRNIHQRIQDREEDVKLLQQPVEAINRSADKTVEDSEKIFTELIHLIQKRSSDVKQQVRSQQETEVSRVKDLQEKVTNISLIVNVVDGLQPQPEPKTRAEFLEYSQEITLDPNTVNEFLLLSEENRKVTVTSQPQSYPPHPERFTRYWQVLSKESLSGRCYWEVEWSGGGLYVAVSCKNISRGGNETLFGCNDKSWALECKQKSFMHNSIETPVSDPRSSRIGVFLDHSAGLLSFYSVSETMTLLHRVQTTFTQPLYAGLCVWIELRDSDPVILISHWCTRVAATAVWNHTVALLFQTAHYSELNLQVVPPVHSCTETEQQWHKPRVEGVKPCPVSKLVITRPRLNCIMEGGIRCTLYKGIVGDPLDLSLLQTADIYKDYDITEKPLAATVVISDEKPLIEIVFGLAQ
ncbi:tripartite motif-containing protein 16-like [Pholidichthys leucotaenia]